jgi:hypothetical protein
MQHVRTQNGPPITTLPFLPQSALPLPPIHMYGGRRKGTAFYVCTGVKFCTAFLSPSKDKKKQPNKDLTERKSKSLGLYTHSCVNRLPGSVRNTQNYNRDYAYGKGSGRS